MEGGRYVASWRKVTVTGKQRRYRVSAPGFGSSLLDLPVVWLDLLGICAEGNHHGMACRGTRKERGGGGAAADAYCEMD